MIPILKYFRITWKWLNTVRLPSPKLINYSKSIRFFVLVTTDIERRNIYLSFDTKYVGKITLFEKSTSDFKVGCSSYSSVCKRDLQDRVIFEKKKKLMKRYVNPIRHVIIQFIIMIRNVDLPPFCILITHNQWFVMLIYPHSVYPHNI